MVDLVGARTALDILEVSKISCPRREPHDDSSVVRPSLNFGSVVFAVQQTFEC